MYQCAPIWPSHVGGWERDSDHPAALGTALYQLSESPAAFPVPPSYPPVHSRSSQCPAVCHSPSQCHSPASQCLPSPSQFHQSPSQCSLSFIPVLSRVVLDEALVELPQLLPGDEKLGIQGRDSKSRSYLPSWQSSEAAVSIPMATSSMYPAVPMAAFRSSSAGRAPRELGLNSP